MVNRLTQSSATADPAACGRCGRQPRLTWAFSFEFRTTGPEQPKGEIRKCLRCALQHSSMLRRSFKLALVVGTLITALNQGNVIVAGDWSNELFWKIPLTYCVPFCVATYASLSTARR